MQIVEVKCHWCPVVDVAFKKRTPWLRYCPVCEGSSVIINGAVDEAKTIGYREGGWPALRAALHGPSTTRTARKKRTVAAPDNV